MIIFVLFILFWYCYAAYSYLKSETTKILYGSKAYDKRDWYLYLKFRNYDSNYNENDKLIKKVLRIVLNFILVLSPLVVALILFITR